MSHDASPADMVSSLAKRLREAAQVFRDRADFEASMGASKEFVEQMRCLQNANEAVANLIQSQHDLAESQATLVAELQSQLAKERGRVVALSEELARHAGMEIVLRAIRESIPITQEDIDEAEGARCDDD